MKNYRPSNTSLFLHSVIKPPIVPLYYFALYTIIACQYRNMNVRHPHYHTSAVLRKTATFGCDTAICNTNYPVAHPISLLEQDRFLFTVQI